MLSELAPLHNGGGGGGVFEVCLSDGETWMKFVCKQPDMRKYIDEYALVCVAHIAVRRWKWNKTLNLC